MHVKAGTRNLRSKKEIETAPSPLTDKTNTINMRSRKKNQENTPSAPKIATKPKPKKARKSTMSKIENQSPKPNTKDRVSKLKTPAIAVKSQDCFGFNDSALYDDGPACQTELTEFDCSKPFRLALYVRPSKRIRIAPSVIDQIQKLNPSLNLTNMTMNSTMARPLSESAMSPNRTQFKVPFASTPKEKPKKKMLQMKITESFMSPKRTRSGNNDQVFKSYFESSGTSDEEVATPPAKIVKKRAKDDVSTASERKIEANNDKTDVVPVTFQKPNRRSYIKKSRPPPEPEDTTPTEEILKSIEKSKKKPKPKKADKEDEEFEKWSRSMNSMFDEVEQFEISID